MTKDKMEGPPASLGNIAYLIDGNGTVTLGRVGPVECAAVANDEARCLAMLVRRDGESVLSLLGRLEHAIADYWERDVFVDEVNG